jgi:hypothetical protein
MSKITGVIDEDGFPVIPDVTVINTLNNTAYKPSAIIDTGAVGLYLKSDLITLLQLEKMDGMVAVHPIHGRQPVDVFEVQIAIQGKEFGLTPVMTMVNNNFPFDLIIGCRFIKNGKMVYDGGSRTVEIIIE